MSKQLIFDREAKEKLLKGAKILKDAVVTTLGPKGRNVSLGRNPLAPKVVHDGVSIAQEITLPDPFENQGAMLVKEAAKKTNDSCGDGTTTATLLAYSIAEAGMQKVLNGANPMILKRGIEKAIEAVVEELKKMAKEIKTTNKGKGKWEERFDQEYATGIGRRWIFTKQESEDIKSFIRNLVKEEREEEKQEIFDEWGEEKRKLLEGFKYNSPNKRSKG